MSKLLVNDSDKLLVGSNGKAYAVRNLDALKGSTSPVDFTAAAGRILRLVRYGKCEQGGTPTPDAPVDIVCNNGAIKARRQSGLPLGYQMVEWIKPTGTIVITGFKTKSTQEIKTVFYREQRGAAYLYASDTATSGTTNTTAYLTSGAGNWRWDGKNYSISVSAGIKITSIQNKDGVWLNDTRAGWYTDPGDFVSTNDLRLSANENTTIRIYSMTIREGETVTLDLVPVQRVTDSAYGFYDKVSGNFYTNADATFEVGPVIDDPVEIYTDGTHPGKNLLNPDAAGVVNGSYIADSGIQASDNTSFLSDYIPVAEGETYTAQGYKTYASSANLRVHGFDASKTWTQMLAKKPMSTSEVTSATFVVPSGVKYVRVCGYIGYRSGRDAMLELGATATAYEPYTETPYLPEVLTVSSPVALSATSIQGNIDTDLKYKTNSDGDCTATPVTVGKTYRLRWTNTDRAVVATVFRYAFADSATPTRTGVDTSQAVRTTIQTVGTDPIVLTADKPYLIVQCNKGKTVANISNGYLVCEEVLQTVSVPMLLGVGNYKDEAELIHGLLTHKIGIKVLDGTENWTAYQTSSGVAVLQNATSAWGAVAGVGGYCTHLTVLQAGETTFAGSCRFATDFNIYEYKTAFGVANVAGFKAKLAEQCAAGTPVIILYPLATPTTENVTPQPLNTGAGTNTLTDTAEVSNPEYNLIYKI